jgi:MFS transporter, DHA1 family, multidrug resistance protein
MRGLVALVAIGVGMATLSAFMTVPFAVFFGFGLVALFCIGLLFGNLNALAMEPMGHIAGTAAAIIAAIANVISLTVGTLVGQLYNGTLVPVALGFASLGGTALWLVWRAEQHKPLQA